DAAAGNVVHDVAGLLERLEGAGVGVTLRAPGSKSEPKLGTGEVTTHPGDLRGRGSAVSAVLRRADDARSVLRARPDSIPVFRRSRRGHELDAVVRQAA